MSAPSRAARWRLPALLALALALTASVRALYFSNQHTYLVRGLAKGGYGDLAEDWLANTADPTPVFSWLVSVGYRLGGEGIFYLAQLLAAAAFFAAILFVVVRLQGWTGPPPMFLFTVLFGAAFTPLIQHERVPDRLDLLVSYGFGDQYALETYIQPSSAAVLLMVGVALFVAGRHPWDVVVIAVAAYLHPTYLLAGALLAGGFAISRMTREGATWRRAATGLGLYALLAAPIGVYGIIVFGTSDPRADAILVHDRLPHHALIGEWFGLDDVGRLALLGVALWLYRRTSIGLAMAAAAAGTAVATGVALATASDRLLLLFPWRASVVLVPLAGALVMASAVDWSWRSWPALRGRPAAALAALGVAGLAAFGAHESRDVIRPRERILEDVARENGTVLVVPPAVDRFRLDSGVPVFVDRKSHPYEGEEVLEWWARLRAAEAVYGDGRCPALADLAGRWDVTHVVVPARADLRCQTMSAPRQDGDFTVWELQQ